MNESLWWAVKLLALLHDVPWKPWVITVAFGDVGRVLSHPPGKEKRPVGAQIPACKDLVVTMDELASLKLPKSDKLEANDWEAIALIKLITDTLQKAGKTEAARILREALKKHWWDVHQADVRASSFDRFFAPIEEEKTKYMKGVKRILLINMFRPEWIIESTRPEPEDICGFVKRILDTVELIAKNVKEDGAIVLKLLYFVLYTLLEPLWYRTVAVNGIPVPPADTRIPHHTVFDHLYAAAMALNMVISGDRWLLVQVDIPGVQEFISRGRKTRDFWAGSWLISLFAWLAVKPFVEAFGPDIVVSPAISLNPFYIALAETLVKKHCGITVKVEWPELAWKDRWPSQPVMPATVTLLLPLPKSGSYIDIAWGKLLANKGCCKIDELNNVDKVEECLECLIRAFVKEAWTSLKENIVKLIDEVPALISYQCVDACENDKSCVDECVKLHRKYLEEVLEEPPFEVKVAVITSTSVKAEIDKVFKTANELVEAFTELKEVLERSLKERMPEPVTLAERVLGFHVALKKLQERMALDKLNVAIRHGVRSSKAVQEFTRALYECKPPLKPRVRLRYCSMCGLLPAVVRAPRVIGVAEQSKASYDQFIREIADKLGYVIDEGEALCPYCLVKRLVACNPSLALPGAERRPLLSTLDVASLWSLLINYNVLGEILSTQRIKVKAVELPVFTSLTEGVKEVFGIDKLKEFNKMLEPAKTVITTLGVDSLLEKFEKIGAELPKYITYVRGDGDYIGKRYWRGALGYKPSEYLEKIYSLVSDVIGKTTVHSKELIELYGKVMDLLKKYNIVDKEATVLLTPSYIYTFSRSLMVTALVDARIVDAVGGVLIYAGGDDIAAILPVYSCVVELNGRKLNPALLSLAYTLSKILRNRSVKGVNETLLARCLNVSAIEDRNLIPYPVDLALLTVALSRLNYWGMLWGASRPGFHVLNEIIAAAAVAYGRSYGVLYSHYRDPMWYAFRVAGELEELKGSIEFRGIRRVIDKDVVIISYGRVPGYALTAFAEALPLTLSSTESVIELISRLMYVRKLLVEGQVSKSIMYDAEEWLKLPPISGNARRKALEALYVKLIERNSDATTLPIMLKLLEEVATVETQIGTEVKPILLSIFRILRFSLLASGGGVV